MAIAFRSSDKNKATSANSVTVTKPAGTISTDFLIAYLHVDGTGRTINTPSGWTKLYDLTSNYHQVAVFHKVAGGSEPANYSFTTTGSTANMAAAICCYSGVDNSSPIHASANIVSLAFVTSHSSPNITVSLSNCWSVLVLTAEGFATSITPPSGYSLRADNDFNPVFGEMDDSNGIISTGTHNAGTWTTGQTKQTIMADLIIAPAAAAAQGGDLMPCMGVV